ncbi:phosphohydrolase [miscellaneous Crenarchaeota group-15 archaeon DG-45]|uniref:Phosphohydrolase n=1 Tax=miscellaneous Crenarchaeota group-15 archaeon DG-45 TaxID=1685127 RepID=A0A0M0BPI8_9ARCH|nr:MAG: phosphohydrolase [miscellaneous Crenarchaeota group-15 archaeon DG-45]
MSSVLSIPTRGNEKLEALLGLVDGDAELRTLWRCANVLAIDRLGFNDHGPVHVKIVANRALKLLRMLVERGVDPSIKANYGMAVEDGEVVVVLASILHDLGMAVVRDDHEVYGVPLALGVLRRLLPACYGQEEATIVASEVLHAVVSHHAPGRPLTVEAGIVKVADALDMEGGRARIPFEAGKVDIHSVSALSIEKVSLEEGGEKPITIRIEMSNPAGIFQVDNLLGAKIKGSGLEDYIHVESVIGGGEEGRIIERFEI